MSFLYVAGELRENSSLFVEEVMANQSLGGRLCAIQFRYTHVNTQKRVANKLTIIHGCEDGIGRLKSPDPTF